MEPGGAQHLTRCSPREVVWCSRGDFVSWTSPARSFFLVAPVLHKETQPRDPVFLWKVSSLKPDQLFVQAGSNKFSVLWKTWLVVVIHSCTCQLAQLVVATCCIFWSCSASGVHLLRHFWFTSVAQFEGGRLGPAEAHRGQQGRKWAFNSAFISFCWNEGRTVLWAAASLSTDSEPVLVCGEMLKAVSGGWKCVWVLCCTFLFKAKGHSSFLLEIAGSCFFQMEEWSRDLASDPS